jgi:hypothetical protein
MMAVKEGIIPRQIFPQFAVKSPKIKEDEAVKEDELDDELDVNVKADDDNENDNEKLVMDLQQLTLMCEDELRKLRPELEMLKATVNNDILHKEEEIARLKKQATADETELDKLRHFYGKHAAAIGRCSDAIQKKGEELTVEKVPTLQPLIH